MDGEPFRLLYSEISAYQLVYRHVISDFDLRAVFAIEDAYFKHRAEQKT
jgi:hypothetical protein